MKPNLNLKGNQSHNMESDKPLNQSLQSGSEKISCMSNNGSSKDYCGTLEVNLKACAKGQNGGSTNMPFFGRDHECKECELKYE